MRENPSPKRITFHISSFAPFRVFVFHHMPPAADGEPRRKGIYSLPVIPPPRFQHRLRLLPEPPCQADLEKMAGNIVGKFTLSTGNVASSGAFSRENLNDTDDALSRTTLPFRTFIDIFAPCGQWLDPVSVPYRRDDECDIIGPRPP